MRWRCFATMLILLLAAPPALAESAKRLTLPNGLRTILKSNWSTEVVSIELLLDISASDEPPGRNGLRYLVQRLLLRGAKGESGESMARRLAAVGGVVDSSVGLDYVEVYALVPAEGFEVALGIVAGVALNPAFPAAEVTRQKIDAGDLARAARDEPFQETYLAFREALYGSHPYGLPTLGTPPSLSGITRGEVVDFHAEHYVADRAVLAICGGVGEARAMRAVREAFGAWPRGRPKAAPEQEVEPLTISEVVARERPLRRAHLILGCPAPAVGEPAYYAMQVVDSLIGGGATARLPRRLRDELGLVYHSSSFYPTLAGPSHLGIYAVTEPFRVETVKAALVGLLADLCRQPVSDEELARAKRYLLGSYALSHQRMKDQAYALAWYEILGLGLEFERIYAESIQSVTASEVQDTARSFLGRFVLAVTMPTS